MISFKDILSQTQGHTLCYSTYGKCLVPSTVSESKGYQGLSVRKKGGMRRRVNGSR